ncbi:uncharacterized protein AMSG_10785 [Thecamonas trahens ATCC 50062]|uniref:Uncharacterized protein n=1 Tax=Thecamonas trahens ATCC 50062 TaxID=461836 RepID=A0A0L0DUL9_THETB|nr:hypothetical protein AMSG_10785 [Thecamonas trahens ATCC 50062]KNC55173.1 hypothetical protein AMSG_10785 [Thecamonas trahens ATCC 50062]|eukprot:XP_013753226.1 hypothetical protein AMSG_10785 [Thecamonas trahens ATCC 50062]
MASLSALFSLHDPPIVLEGAAGAGPRPMRVGTRVIREGKWDALRRSAAKQRRARKAWSHQEWMEMDSARTGADTRVTITSPPPVADGAGFFVTQLGLEEELKVASRGKVPSKRETPDKGETEAEAEALGRALTSRMAETLSLGLGEREPAEPTELSATLEALRFALDHPVIGDVGRGAGPELDGYARGTHASQRARALARRGRGRGRGRPERDIGTADVSEYEGAEEGTSGRHGADDVEEGVDVAQLMADMRKRLAGVEARIDAVLASHDDE